MFVRVGIMFGTLPLFFLLLLGCLITNEELEKGPGGAVSEIFGGTCKGPLLLFAEEDPEACPFH